MNIVLLAHQKGTRLLSEPNCVALSFHTNEVSPEQFEKLRGTHNQHVTLLITDENIDYQEALTELAKVKLNPGEKWTPSQILRFSIIDHASRLDITDRQEQEKFYRERMRHYIADSNSMDI